MPIDTQRALVTHCPGPRVSWLQVLREDLNFLLTNRIPRRLATRMMAWFSRLEAGWLTRATIAAWRACAADLDLSEARARRFRSLHECFIRQLKEGTRPVDVAAILRERGRHLGAGAVAVVRDRGEAPAPAACSGS